MRMAIAPGIHILTMRFGFPRFGSMKVSNGVRAHILCGMLSFLLLFSPRALAHDHHAPPVRIITDEQAGPWTVSVWAQQHMDTGRFFVQVHPSSGTMLPPDLKNHDLKMNDLKVEVGVQPANQNSLMTFYSASSDSPDGQYQADVPFDTQQAGQVKVRLQNSRGVNEITTYLGTAPAGSGEWQLLFYSLPFLSVGGQWLRVYWLRRGVKSRLALTHS